MSHSQMTVANDAKPSSTKITNDRDWPPLPKLSRTSVMAIEDYLTKQFNSKRPPEVAAKVLALVVELWERDEPFPMRAHVAHDLGCSKWGVDAVLNTALERELITIRIGTETSTKTVHRPACVQDRYFTPSDELIMASEPRRAHPARKVAGQRSR